MKQLSKKWKEHIKKMVEYSQRANKLKLELDEYLNKPEFKDESYETNMFEDSIIDTMTYTGDWKNLIQIIENTMNNNTK